MEQNVSVSSVAQDLRVSENALRRLELYNKGLGRRKRYELCRLLKRSIEDIFGENF